MPNDEILKKICEILATVTATELIKKLGEGVKKILANIFKDKDIEIIKSDIQHKVVNSEKPVITAKVIEFLIFQSQIDYG